MPSDSMDDFVITGLSARLPESDNVEEFAKNLFAGVDMVTEDNRRWTPGLYGLPKRQGKLKNLNKFDAMFFGITPKQAEVMDPQQRMLLELAFEAIVDAGYNPAELRGKSVGVYVGASYTETGGYFFEDINKIESLTGYEALGCNLGMCANRISYTFDLKGPSFTVDTGCSSSMFGLCNAVMAMRLGQADAALVAGVNLCLCPMITYAHECLKMLSADGRCAAFDASGEGYVRSEGAVVLLLQRRSAARRVYATLRGIRSNADGTKEKGITFPSGEMQGRLAKATLKEAGIDARDIVYVEAHGTGTKAGDPEEANVIADLFCKNRNTPLLIGSVKSNMGHGESSSGMCSITKLIISMETGVIPGNLHYKTPNPDIPSLSDGRIQVVSSNTPWKGGLVSINCFGFGGANVHTILESHNGNRPPPVEYGAVPRLIVASGRTDEAVHALLQHGAAHPGDGELHALLDAVHALPVAGHSRRGYRLLGDGVPAEEVLEWEGEPRPVWFVFSGMGSQWAGMGRALLRLPAFARSVERSAAALRPHGLDLLSVLNDIKDSAFENIINSFVAITAVQVALVDMLKELNIYPDGIVGHSVGEIGCAYADGTLTAEQAVLCAYWRGRSVVDAKLVPGAMAAVDLTWEQTQARCPPGVVVACQNSDEIVTISGEKDAVNKFIQDLRAEDVFTKRVRSEDIAFHSPLIAPAAPVLLAHLKTVIPEPRKRSERWISSSLSPEELNSEIGKWSSADYFVHNFVSPVRFWSAVKKVPANAIVVEVAPHALLGAVLRRALPGAAHVPLVRRDAPCALRHLLAAVGRLFAAGAQPTVAALYPTVHWPVSRGTPGLASHVKWDHSDDWFVARFERTFDSAQNIEFDLSKPENEYLIGYKIDGKVIFPMAAYMSIVWQTFATICNTAVAEVPVVIEDLRLTRPVVMPLEGAVRFQVSVLSGGAFEVSESDDVVATGRVRRADSNDLQPLPDQDTTAPALSSADAYQELRLRGFQYDGVFKVIRHFYDSGLGGSVKWDQHGYIPFLDGLIQFDLIAIETRDMHLPTSVRRVVIDPTKHGCSMSENSMQVKRCPELKIIEAGGVQIQGIKWTLARRQPNAQRNATLEKFIFVPYVAGPSLQKEEALTVCIQLALENSGSLKVKLRIGEAALDQSVERLLLPVALPIIEAEPYLKAECYLVTGASGEKYTGIVEKMGVSAVRDHAGVSEGFHLLLATEVLSRQSSEMIQLLTGALAPRGMLLLEEPPETMNNPKVITLLQDNDLDVISRIKADERDYILLRYRQTLPSKQVVIEVPDLTTHSESSFDWVDGLRDALICADNEVDSRVYVVSRDIDSGILGMAMCLLGETGARSLRVFHIPNGPEFSLNMAPYAEQIQKDMTVNVLRAGVWGTLRHLKLADNGQLQVEHAYVNTLMRGDLSSLRWIESPLRWANDQPLPKDADLCEVHYAPLNFRDIMLATGKLPPDALPGNLASQDCILGLEFSGRSSSGERVMGMVPACGLATTVMANKDFLWQVPDQWSLEDASTVPVAYATAYYALAVRGRMRRGEALLVHAGTGGVGQAAIAIALHAGCTVYTTVGTAEKRAFLRSRFPSLPDANIGNSRDTSFEQLVLRRTGGRGVDLVLNSLAADKLQASLRCLAPGGRFLEIGKLDLSNDSPLGMSVFLKNTTFHGILLDALFDKASDHEEKAAVIRCVAEGITNGAVRPLPTTVFSQDRLEEAFRYMATGKHMGKVVLRIRENETPIASKMVSAIPHVYFNSNKVYILVGGLGGLGLELAWWLIGRGVTKLVLTSRSGVRSGYQARCLRRMKEKGVHVVVSTIEAGDVTSARTLLREAAAMGSVGGVYNLASVLRDAFIENLTPDDFRTVAFPKVNVTYALSEASNELAPELDHFVVFSSATSGRGNAGQSTYGFANSVMERIMERRHAAGLPALAIQWGPMAETGMFLKTKANDEMEFCGTLPQNMASFREALDKMMLNSAFPVQSSLVRAKKQDNGGSANRGDAVRDIARILGLKDDNIPENKTLADLGIDSLMITEVQSTLERKHDLLLTTKEIRVLTFSNLREQAKSSQ